MPLAKAIERLSTRPARRSRQHGQALAETLVACIVLVPFVLLIVLLGKFQSVQQATIAGSRSMAFECTVRIEACERNDASLIEEVRQRHFAHPSLSLETQARVTDADSVEQRHPLWADRRNRSLLERFDDVGATVTEHELNGGFDFAIGRNGRGAQAIAGRLADPPARFGLRTTAGLFEARVQANLSARTGADSFLTQLDNLRITPSARTAIAVDAWNASGPYGLDDEHSVEARVDQGKSLGDFTEGLLWTAYLPMRGFMWMMWAAQLEDRGDEFRYHETDVDLVPADRIGR